MGLASLRNVGPWKKVAPLLGKNLPWWWRKAIRRLTSVVPSIMHVPRHRLVCKGLFLSAILVAAPRTEAAYSLGGGSFRTGDPGVRTPAGYRSLRDTYDRSHQVKTDGAVYGRVGLTAKF